MGKKKKENTIKEPLILYKNEKLAKALAGVKANILNREGERTIKSILITSSVRGEGTTTVALNYAAVSSESDGTKTLLIDANLRHPMIHKVFGIDNTRGFSEIVFEQANPSETIKASGIANLDIIPAGGLQVNLNRVFSKTLLRKAISEISGDYEAVILDGPAVSVFPDAPTMAGLVDGVIIVVAAHRTRREVIIEAKERLEEVGGHLLGTVLNKREYVIPERIYRKL